MPYLIVLADNHVLVRQGIKKIIEEKPELKVVGEMGNGLELLDYLDKNIPPPDMVILDISMPNLGGIKATRKIKENYSDIKVLILTMHEDAFYMNQSLAMGAEGYLLKQELDEELFTAISTIRQGDIYICPLMRRFAV